MIIAKWTAFIGADNNTNPKGLPEGVGQVARNLDTIHGDLRGRTASAAVFTLPGLSVQQKTIYRMGRDAPSDTAYWLTWNADVNVVRSMLATDSTERTYYTGDGIPKYTDNTHLGTAPYPTGFTTLGVPAPTSTLHAAVHTAGTGPSETRAYTETFRRANGDESAPNGNPIDFDCLGGSSVDLTGLAPPPSGAFGTVTRRIYVSTGSDYQLCLEQAASLTTATDDGATRQQVLATGGSSSRPAWLTPPDDLAGLTELWNGMVGGFTGKSYRVCVAYTMHAWPIEYEGIVPDTIVGSATYGQQWVLITTGLPRVVTGSTSGSMSDQPIYLKQAGVSKRSVVGVGHGVCWASKDGLCYTGSLGTYVMTEKFMSKAVWANLNPSSIVGVSWGRWYIGFYNNGTVRQGFMIDTTNPVAFFFLDQGADAVFYDLVSQSLYLLDTGNVITKWDAGTTALTATFTTSIKRTTEKSTPGVAQVIATAYPVTFTVFGDKVSRYVVTVNDSMPFHLPGNYGGASEFYVKLQGTGPIEAALLAEEMDDLP